MKHGELCLTKHNAVFEIMPGWFWVIVTSAVYHRRSEVSKMRRDVPHGDADKLFSRTVRRRRHSPKNVDRSHSAYFAGLSHCLSKLKETRVCSSQSKSLHIVFL